MLDATVWAPEIAGQRFAASIERLRDDLRAADKPFKVLLAAPVGDFIIGDFKNPHSIEHGIQIQTMQAVKRSLSPAERRQWLAFFNAQKIRLEQSEWRHERFWPKLDGVPQSRCFFSLHALQPAPETRYIFRGQIQIRWQTEAGDAVPSMQSVEVLQAELLSRKGPTPFSHVVPADLTPNQDALRFEPNLHVYDLDGNGLADIVLSRINRVY